jgi:Fe-S-cluster containining protein
VTFPCSRCGACCRVAGLVEESLNRGDGACVHLRGEPGGEHSCAVYEDRPDACRVDALKPDTLTDERWHALNLAQCDKLHLQVYGVPRG